MKFVLDTNILVASLAIHSPSYRIIEELLNGNFEIVISNEILTEYEEVLVRKYGQNVA
jgi:uncharacterized protein